MGVLVYGWWWMVLVDGGGGGDAVGGVGVENE